MTQPTIPIPGPPPGDPASVPTPTPVPTPPPTPAPTPAPPGDKPLGPAGESALQAERDARKALEKSINDQLAPLRKLAEMLGAGTPAAAGKNEVDLLNERFAEHEKTVTAERQARWRAEVANEKGLTSQQAARLTGASREELLTDADSLLTLFPAPAPGSKTPVPDPSQGAHGGSTPDLESQIAEAQKAGDIRKVILLQRQKLQNVKR